MAILIVALLIIMVVVVGVHGAGRKAAPEIASVMERTARQLNGDAAPPRGVRMLFDEMDRVSAADLHPRQITGRIRQSIASARSAMSAQSPSSPPSTVSEAAHEVAAQLAGEDTIPQMPRGESSVSAAPAPVTMEDPYGLVEGPIQVAGEDPAPEESQREPVTDTIVRVDLPQHPSHR